MKNESPEYRLYQFGHWWWSQIIDFMGHQYHVQSIMHLKSILQIIDISCGRSTACALHLLELHGHMIGESDQSVVSNAFLMEIMEAREEVEHASTDAQLKPLLKACQTRQSELCKELEKSFDDHSVDDAKLQTARLQYLRRIEDTILEKITSTE
jgi:hypothetical protein